MTRDEAWKLAEHWIAAWNAHDLDLIMTHYEDAIELTSPVVAQLLGTADGKVIGKANLKAYFRRGLEAYPELNFRLNDVLLGVSSVVLFYTNQKGTHTAEFMEFSPIEKLNELSRITVLRRRDPAHARVLTADLERAHNWCLGIRSEARQIPVCGSITHLPDIFVPGIISDRNLLR